MSKPEITIEHLHPSGGLRLSAILDGYYEHEDFYGYTESEAVELFREWHNL